MSRRQSAPRLEFEAAAIYEYPEHLRPWLEALPKQPGVYFFHGESDAMPLYIGKSVNIRSRVLSHLRTPDEAAMLRQSRRITGRKPPVSWALCYWKPVSSRSSNRCSTNGYAATASSVRCRSPRANRRSCMPGRSISLTPRTCMACLLIAGQRCKPYRRWPMSASSATACLGWSR